VGVGGIVLRAGSHLRLTKAGRRMAAGSLAAAGREENAMPLAQHRERHFTGSGSVRDVVIGMADGLTVPFALAAGLSGATGAAHIILTAGLAEIAAGSISMGLGGYLAARSDVEHYRHERRREEAEVVERPADEEGEVREILATFGVAPDGADTVVAAMRERPKAWVDFMMRFELGLEEPAPGRALISAVTIAGAYVLGGLVPLAPYLAVSPVRNAVIASAAVTTAALFVFGYVKGRFTGVRPLRAAVQTAVVGGLAAAAAFALARLVMS